MFLRNRILIGVFICVLLASGCAPVPAVAIPTATIPAPLTPYASSTASATPKPTSPGTSTPLPSPSPTPRSHTVARGEDMGGIAFRYKISLQALMAANPNVSPNTMSVGTVLIIPGSSAPVQSTGVPTPTPLPLKLQPVSCASSQEGGLWCFVLVKNNRKTAVENLSAVIRVADAKTGQLFSQTALPPLDILPAGKKLPLAAYFPPPAPTVSQASAELLTSIPVASGSSRYLPASLTNQQISIASDGLSAQIQGQVQLGKTDQKASQVWVAAVAYDATGAVMGVRRWENQKPLAPSEEMDFSFRVYSTGAPIQQVELLVEARP